MKRLMFLLLQAIALPPVFAEDGPGIISGIVQDELGVFPGAPVLLTRTSDDAPAGMAVTDRNGIFTLVARRDECYILSVRVTGMEYYSREVTMTGDTLTLPVIMLKPQAGMLDEVTVRAKIPAIEVRPGMLVVNVEHSIASEGSSALDILARAPGVRVDQNDVISLKGKQGVIIQVDGRNIPLSGTELADMLKSMPSASVAKVELISNPGARYDAAGNAGIINIRTRKDAGPGINGSVNASYAQGIYPKANSGGSLNYRHKKLSLFTTYNYSYRYFFNNLKLDRRFYDEAGRQLFRYAQDNHALYDFRNQTGTLGLDYRVTKHTTAGFSVNGGINLFNPGTDNASLALNSDNAVLYYFNTKGRHRNRFYNASANVYLRHDFKEEGRSLSADVDYAGFGNNSRQQFRTVYTTPEGSAYLPDYLLKSDLNGSTGIRTLKIDYADPLPGDARLDAGIKTSYVNADNKSLFYEMQEDGYEPDPKRSNHFIYRENINAAYLNLSRNGARWSTQLGLRAEHTQASWEQKTTSQQYDTGYVQLFPSLALQRHLTERHDLGVSVSRRIERPGYQQLNPFRYFIDKTTYREGSPYLKPALSYAAELSHSFRQKLVTTISYSVTDHVITEVIQPGEQEDSVTVQTNRNLRRMVYTGLSGAYSVNITGWWTTVTGFNAYYAVYEGFVANTRLRGGRPAFDLNTKHSFSLPESISAEVGFSYQSRQIYGFMDIKPVWMLDAGLQKYFKDKRIAVRLNVQDIFWKGYPAATSVYAGYREDFVAIRDTRQATISFTYRFGNKREVPVRQRSGGAEEEKLRARSGNA